jgi:large repetitive protein
MQATNGTLYGTTEEGGANEQDGTVFSLSAGLGPFVETLFTSGKVGAGVIILGNNLTGTTSVNFNGAAATFTVVSRTEIKTTVPAGATTGTVTVTTPSGTLNSNVAFRVTPSR